MLLHILLGTRRSRISLSLEEGLAGCHQTLVYNVRRMDLTVSLQPSPNPFPQPDRSPRPSLFGSPKQHRPARPPETGKEAQHIISYYFVSPVGKILGRLLSI